MTRYEEPPQDRVPRSAARIRVEAVFGVAVEFAIRVDAYLAACLDARPLRRHVARFAGWVRAAYGRARARARRRAFGPGHALVAVPRRELTATAVDVTPTEETEREREING